MFKKLILATVIVLLASVSYAEPLPDLKPFPKWEQVVTKMGDIKPLEILDDKSIKQAAIDVDKFVDNKYKFISDRDDYWKTPQEFQKDGGGDCEDFSIVKYYYLLKAGVPDKYMYIMVGLTDQQDIHAVLVVDTIDGRVVLNSPTETKPRGPTISKTLFLINRKGYITP